MIPWSVFTLKVIVLYFFISSLLFDSGLFYLTQAEFFMLQTVATLHKNFLRLI